MSTSFPYLTISRCIGADYGRVLAIAGKFDIGYRLSDLDMDEPFARNVYFVWCQEQKRRRDASTQ